MDKDAFKDAGTSPPDADDHTAAPPAGRDTQSALKCDSGRARQEEA
jgi:hypothetical protein